jgi:hypothetical protein
MQEVRWSYSLFCTVLSCFQMLSPCQPTAAWGELFADTCGLALGALHVV